jgi:hypothetical protein
MATAAEPLFLIYWRLHRLKAGSEVAEQLGGIDAP